MAISKVELLKKCINNLRDLRKMAIKSDDLNEEDLYFLQEGYWEGLCSAAMTLADELDALDTYDGEDYDSYIEQEEDWWHTHDEFDIGGEERL